jgi:hypothetical protein
VAAGLCIFWLLISEGINWLFLAGQRVFLLQNSRFNKKSANQTNFVLLRAAIIKQNKQRENQFENM